MNRLTLPLLYTLLYISKKARSSLQGRQGWKKRYREFAAQKNGKKKIVHFHAASAGEYLCAKPVIKQFYEQGYLCIVTVTSISGYQWLAREKNPHLAFFDYLPADLASNVRFFYRTIQPVAVVFVKTDLWPNLIMEGAKRQIALFLISASITRESSKYRSKLSRSYHRFLYRHMDGIYTADPESAEIFSGYFLPGETLFAGDSRYDMVADRKKSERLPGWLFPKEAECLVLGSVWQSDIAEIGRPLCKLMHERPQLHVIAAPHETTEKEQCLIESTFRDFTVVRYSSLDERTEGIKPQKEMVTARVVSVDRVGPLFSLYNFANAAYVGGGFGAGIHNILEPLAMGAPVIFGPRHRKFPEAKEAIDAGVAFSVVGAPDFAYVLEKMLGSHKGRHKQQALDFVENHSGVSQKYFQMIHNKINAKSRQSK